MLSVKGQNIFLNWMIMPWFKILGKIHILGNYKTIKFENTID